MSTSIPLLAANQVAFEFRTMRRNRSAVVFTFVFPVMFLVIFGLNAGGRTQTFDGHTVAFIQFFVPGILAYGVIGACYNNLAMRITLLRENGVLKRLRGTPLPTPAYLAGHIGTSLILTTIIAAITLAVGVIFYDVQLYAHTVPAMLLTLLTGAASFCAVGLAVASLIPNADSAPGIVNVTLLPIVFISDIFYSIEGAPRWLESVANFFPVKHFANALQVTFNPSTSGSGVAWNHLGVLAAWGVLSAIYASRKFRWESSRKAG
jgi:ABC-2 type transport system permease protein